MTTQLRRQPTAQVDIIEFEGAPIYNLGPMRQQLDAYAALYRPSTARERMGLFIGMPGLGKTTAARLFASQHRDVLYMSMLPRAAMRSAGAVIALTEISLGLTVFRFNGMMHRMAVVAEHLRNGYRMLIIDTAHRLRYDDIDVFRWFHDETGICTVFTSVPALLPMFEQHLEFGSRVQIRRELRGLTLDETALLLPAVPDGVLKYVHDKTKGRVREVLRYARLITSADNRTPAQWTEDDVARLTRGLVVGAA